MGGVNLIRGSTAKAGHIAVSGGGGLLVVRPRYPGTRIIAEAVAEGKPGILNLKLTADCRKHRIIELPRPGKIIGSDHDVID